MQLKKLTIHNIASIEDAVIDFSEGPLEKAPIFLICGETGAGKTTILDAICLALYGETPRMTSVSREELEMTDPNDTKTDKYYSNDNSQLLHRGAGEGFSKLLFTGNDNKDYEAIWEIHRAHNKAHKRLMRPTRLLIAVDGSYSENRINEIKPKIVKLTGLEYEQFCRTVMLAQGEFTKFLKSNRIEKSEILEKLTGTEIYSRLGIRIAERYNSAKSEWQNLKGLIDRIHLIDADTLKSMEENGVNLKAQIDKESNDLKILSQKLSWLMASLKYETQRKQIASIVEKLEESTRSESFLKDKTLVKDYDQSATGRAVLDNMIKNDIEIQRRTENMAPLQQTVDQAKEAYGKLCQFHSDALVVVEKREKEIEKLDLSGVAKQYHEITKEDNLLAKIQTQIEKLHGDENALKLLNEQRSEYQKRCDDNRKTAESLVKPIEDAERELLEWSEKLDKAEISVDSMVKDIRSRLHHGDMCPVCGTVVQSDIGEGYFDELLVPLRESKKRAEEVFRERKSSREAALSLVKSDEKAMKKNSGKIAEAESALKKTEKGVEKLLKEAGFENLKGEEVDNACKERRDSLQVLMDSLRNKQKEGEALQNELKRERKLLVDAAADLEKGKDILTTAESMLKENDAAIQALRDRKEGMWEELRLFYIKNQEIDTVRLKELCSCDEEEMRILKDRITAAEDSLKIEKGKLEALCNQIAENDKAKPEMGEEESVESLESLKAAAEDKIKSLSEENGRLSEALEQDRRQRKEVEDLQKRYDKARDEFDKWEGLYNRLGDLNGTKFRSIAQSFILKSLLENANLYMKRFNDRYTLTCNPGTLTILVKDDYKPSDPQPASILSGGESFMASLSLALALANLQSGGVAADILFIDEGFGTLSGEYLGNVMDTLERLHQIGGRKVGLISHVTDMKERIPVQIKVSRESPALSRVEIIEAY